MFSVKLVALFFIVSVAVSWIPGSPSTGVALAASKLHIDGSTNVVNNGYIGQMVVGSSRDGGETAAKSGGLAHMGVVDINRSNKVVYSKPEEIRRMFTIAKNQGFKARISLLDVISMVAIVVTYNFHINSF
ncbi:uncharacterized protein LOC142981812 [Anticarsia gemmatalis]|uniref:uncharacterized protein LOC142981812 n=1 Tax=Anticarsia gemmatalis TaxID=129554 RepID=UPI003F774E94